MAQKRDPTLAVAAAAVALLAALTALRLVLRYGHPDDRRSAWVPRGVAALGFALAACTLLLFPLDVANGRACAAQRAKAPAASPSLALTAAALASSCVEGVPAAALWRAAYISNGVVTFLIIPLAYFYYLGDSELGAGARLASCTARRQQRGLAWVAAGTCTDGDALVMGSG